MSLNRQPVQSSAQPCSALPPRVGWQVHLAVLAALMAVAALLYYPSLRSPWYLDDISAIVQNPAIRDLGRSLGDLFLPRGLALFSFALNYRFGGLDPLGYHLVNLALHIGCALLVYLLLRQVLRERVLLPALGALLFVAHPLQTQAVTYVVQRMAVLAAFCFLLSLYLFFCARARLAAGAAFAEAGHLGYYCGAIIAGLCAILTKENTVVLPVALYLCVTLLLLPGGDRRRLLLSLLPWVVGALALAAQRLLVPLAEGETLARIAGTTYLTDARQLTPLHYLVTEFSVLWIYLRMLLLPYGQAFEHNVRIATDLFELRHLLAGTGLALLGMLAIKVRRRQPLIAAGIAWFFLTLAVESSIIPLDPFYEHRLYLPLFGFILALFGLLQLLPGRAAIVVLVVMTLVYLPLTWQRNRLWADPVAFYRDNLVKAPHNERVLTDYALRILNEGGRLVDAEPLLLEALAYHPDYLPARISLVSLYSRQERLTEAFAAARQGLEKYPHSPPLLRALATLYSNTGDLEPALLTLDQILAQNPRQLAALLDRAFVLARLGRLPEAETEFRKVLAIDVGNAAARNGLVLTLKSQGKPPE